MSHDDSSGGAGSPLITTPNTGRDGWASEQTESVLRVIPALLCNAAYLESRLREERNMPSSHHCMAEARAGIAIQTHMSGGIGS